MTQNELNTFIQENPIAVLHFKTNNCGVCEVIYPRVESIAEQFNVPILVVNVADNMELAAQNMVMNAPLTKVFVDGREVFKEGAYIRLDQLEDLLAKYSEMLKDEN